MSRTASQSSLLIYAPVPLHLFEGELYIERQAVNGVRLWARHFEKITVMMPVSPTAPPAGWVPLRQFPEALSRVSIEPLPMAYRPDQFLYSLPQTLSRIRELIKEADYLSFAIGGLFGDWGAVSCLAAHQMQRPFAVCNSGKLGITQSIGPGYRIVSKVKWLFGKFAIIKSQNFKHAISSKISLDKARKLAFAPHINVGVFSLEKNSPCWGVWQNNLKETIKHGRVFGSEGLAINLSVYIDEVDTEFLPLGCNWITSNLLPKFDENKQEFVEPFLPNTKIGIMHLAAGIWKDGKDMRLDNNVKIDIKSLNGTTLTKSLRFK